MGRCFAIAHDWKMRRHQTGGKHVLLRTAARKWGQPRRIKNLFPIPELRLERVFTVIDAETRTVKASKMWTTAYTGNGLK